MSTMTDRTLLESINKLKADGSNYREWCVKTRAIINQQRLGKYLKPCRDATGKYLSTLSEEDDLVALSYIQLSIHNDHLKYIQHVETTYDTWEALRTIYESTSEVTLVSLQLQIFADQFQEFMRKMTAAGDATPAKSHINRFLCLLPSRFSNTVMFITRESRTSNMYNNMPAVLAELKLDDERQQLSDPKLRKHIGKTDEALNTTSNLQCHYCNKPGHIRPDCRRHQADEARGIHRRSVQEKPQSSGNNGKDNRYTNGRTGGRGRGRSQRDWRGHDQGNNADDLDNGNDDLFMVETGTPASDHPDDDTWWQTKEEPIEIDVVADELSQYVTCNNEIDECNAISSPVKREAIIDSGATAHMTGDIELLHAVTKCIRAVRLADGHPIQVTKMGDLKIKSTDTGRVATFKNVLYVPTLKKTLVSISRINRQSDDASITFKADECHLKSRNKLSITAKWNTSFLYAIQGTFILPGTDDEANAAETADAMLWHARMGHIPATSMVAVCAATTGGPSNLPKSVTCEDCIRGKITHNSVPKTGDRPNHPLGTCVHTDLWGPAKVATPNGSKY
ncbi:hypothetical protein AeMF1_014657, partial [Aphanomyces euteiches]